MEIVGLSRNNIEKISAIKKEDEWVKQLSLIHI